MDSSFDGDSLFAELQISGNLYKLVQCKDNEVLSLAVRIEEEVKEIHERFGYTVMPVLPAR